MVVLSDGTTARLPDLYVYLSIIYSTALKDGCFTSVRADAGQYTAGGGRGL